jgi:hypothetical protein
MNEARIDLTSQDSTQEVDAVDDRLLTRRLPPMTPPPPRATSVPPPSASPPSLAPSGTYPANSAGITQPRTSWWNALLTKTFPPPSLAPAPPTDERVLRRRLGATCGGMALGFVILGLALGLRGAEAAYTPMVTAALVLGRSVLAVGFLGFGYGLLRMAERLLTSIADRAGRSSDQA